MIILHYTEENSFTERIRETLNDMVVAYQTKKHSESESIESFPAKERPFLEENGTIISGREEIKTYLKEFQYELDQWRAFTSDACYIDPETGEIC